VLAASADYLARYGEPQAPEDLTRHRCLNYGHSTAMQRWRLTRDGETIVVPITSRLCSNNGDVLRAAALKGNGITRLPTFIVGADIKARRLREVLPSYAPTSLGIYALYAPNRYLAAKTRVLIDFLVRRCGNDPPWDGYRT
jgi:DNA-binding transcriptional LysR family regulator